MSGPVQFLVPGEPVAQPRPRVFGAGRVQSDSKESKAWKAAAKAVFAARLDALNLPSPLFPSGPVGLVVIAAFPLPRGEHRQRTVTPMRWHTARPDVDNVLKAPMDAASPQTIKPPAEARTAKGQDRRMARYERELRKAARGLLWRNDSQVCWCQVVKMCSGQNEAPQAWIEVRALDEADLWLILDYLRPRGQ